MLNLKYVKLFNFKMYIYDRMKYFYKYLQDDDPGDHLSSRLILYIPALMHDAVILDLFASSAIVMLSVT